MDRSPPHPGRGRRRWRGRIGATAASAAAHVALVAALLAGWRTAAPTLFAPPIPVTLAPPLLQPQPPAAPSPARKSAHAAAHRSAAATLKPAAAHAPDRRRDEPPPLAARPSRAPPVDTSPPAAALAATGPGGGDGLTQAQLAGAQAAGEGDGGGSGDGGGACDMARRVQAAVRKDPLARAAIHTAGGRAIMIWNGDWVQHGDEDGKGLAAVREAISFEVAFAPPACRHQRVRGLVLISLADGSARLALGAGEWRWSDLLGLR